MARITRAKGRRRREKAACHASSGENVFRSIRSIRQDPSEKDGLDGMRLTMDKSHGRGIRSKAPVKILTLHEYGKNFYRGLHIHFTTP